MSSPRRSRNRRSGGGTAALSKWTRSPVGESGKSMYTFRFRECNKTYKIAPYVEGRRSGFHLLVRPSDAPEPSVISSWGIDANGREVPAHWHTSSYRNPQAAVRAAGIHMLLERDRRGSMRAA